MKENNVGDTIEPSTDATKFTTIATSSQESSSNTDKIHEKSSKLNENSNEVRDVLESSIGTTKLKTGDSEVENMKPLNSCEKPCDDGSCPIDGKCHNKLTKLKCKCNNGTCYENICICKPGFTISSSNSSNCIQV